MYWYGQGINGWSYALMTISLDPRDGVVSLVALRF